MARKDASLDLTAKGAAAAFTDPIWAVRFPPLLSVAQAAELAQVPIGTIYDWSSRGLLDCCKLRAGKHVRFTRNRFYQSLCNGELHGNR